MGVGVGMKGNFDVRGVVDFARRDRGGVDVGEV